MSKLKGCLIRQAKLVADHPLVTVMAAFLSGPTRRNLIMLIAEVEEPNLSKQLIPRLQEEMLYHFTPGSLELLSFKKGKNLDLNKDKVCPLPMESLPQKKRDTGIGTTESPIELQMDNNGSCYPDGIFTISEQGRMRTNNTGRTSTVLFGLLVQMLMYVPQRTFQIGILLATKLSRLGLRLARFCLKAIMLKAQEGLLLARDLALVHPAEHLVSAEAEAETTQLLEIIPLK
ncbi:internal protein [Betacoronavirus HKU24]|uniref:Protein I n=1 Tax=Betacoronavirus HKU24 TaxID=1590370 RepID=A0A0A7V3X8_9BETC|nr:internal protein [Betacoronavirus HKU24]AJA91201.1 internal protein [Betacoronavirus HKU24]AJA91212.1 internal protein [Betacoronavirus HKU24]AJA91222.1 internal protein [Betacoronavirus HKU24]